MKKIFQLLNLFCAICAVSLFCGQAHAADRCYSKMSEVLECFLNHNDGAYKYEFVEENNANVNVTIRTYLLYSQRWPVDNYPDIPSTIWKHKLVFYIPKNISYSKVLLHVGGGRNKNIEGVEEFLSSKEQIDYAGIAISNRAVVVELQDALNQYLFLIINRLKRTRF